MRNPFSLEGRTALVTGASSGIGAASARALAAAGFHVVCDKPLVHTREQADALVAAVARQGTVFGVTYNYTGYPMVRQAREMVRAVLRGEDGPFVAPPPYAIAYTLLKEWAGE